MTFSGKIYFITGFGEMVCCWDTITHQLSAVTQADPSMPDFDSDKVLTSTSTLPDGSVILNREQGTSTTNHENLQMLRYSSGLSSRDAHWLLTNEDTSDFTGPTGNDPDQDTTLYDPVEDVLWTRFLCGAPSTLWHTTGLDPSSGAQLQHKGDASVMGSWAGDLAGLSLIGANTALLGRWFYGNMTYGGLSRLNLSTGQWQSIGDRTVDNDERAVHFLGTDEVNNHLITMNNISPFHPESTGHQYWIQVRDPDADAWTDVVDTTGYVYPLLGAPLAEYPLTSAWYNGDNPPFLYTQTSRGVAVANGELVMLAPGSRGATHGFDDDGNMWGNSYTVWVMDLTDGTLTQIDEIPFTAFDEYGNIVPGTYSGSWFFTAEDDVIGMSLTPRSGITSRWGVGEHLVFTN